MKPTNAAIDAAIRADNDLQLFRAQAQGFGNILRVRPGLEEAFWTNAAVLADAAEIALDMNAVPAMLSRAVLRMFIECVRTRDPLLLTAGHELGAWACWRYLIRAAHAVTLLQSE